MKRQTSQNKIHQSAGQYVLNSQNLKTFKKNQSIYDPKSVQPIVKSAQMEETKTQLTYNPYKMKDFKKMQEKQSVLAKGLGSNIGDDKWHLANEKKERLK